MASILDTGFYMLREESPGDSVPGPVVLGTESRPFLAEMS